MAWLFRWLSGVTIVMLLLGLASVTAMAIDMLRLDRPIAKIRVSHEADAPLSDELAFALTEKALERIDFAVVEPMPVRLDPDQFIARNALAPEDRLHVMYRVAGERFDTYSVRLERDGQGVVATVSANWK